MRGVPAQDVGIQAHLLQNNPSLRAFAATWYRSILRAIAGMGLAVYSAEPDANDGNVPWDTTKRYPSVAAVYRDYLAMVLDERAMQAVLRWGLSDRPNWADRSRPRADVAHTATSR
jgi:endo-1,4-beta-xylanase